MTKRSRLSEREEDLLDGRSVYSLYGSVEIFLGADDGDVINLSPEASAAKLIADLVLLAAETSSDYRRTLAAGQAKLVVALDRLMAPMTAGQTTFYENADTADQIFLNMLQWLREDDGGDPAFAVDGFDTVASAASIALDMVLDSADIRHTIDRALHLDIPSMMHCMEHLLSRIGALIDNCGGSTAAPGEMKRQLFVSGLKYLIENQSNNPCRPAQPDMSWH